MARVNLENTELIRYSYVVVSMDFFPSFSGDVPFFCPRPLRVGTRCEGPPEEYSKDTYRTHNNRKFGSLPLFFTAARLFLPAYPAVLALWGPRIGRYLISATAATKRRNFLPLLRPPFSPWISPPKTLRRLSGRQELASSPQSSFLPFFSPLMVFTVSQRLRRHFFEGRTTTPPEAQLDRLINLPSRSLRHFPKRST